MAHGSKVIDIQNDGGSRLAALFQSRGTRVKIEPGAAIAYQGEGADFVYRILRGCVRACVYTEDGARKVLQFQGPDDYLGLSDVAEWGAAQEAVDAVLLEAVPRATFEAEAMACTELQADIRHELVRSIEAHAALLVLLAQTTAVERVRLFLKRFAARRPGADFVSLPMGRRDIADHLGLSMETVSRAFSSLRARGDIAMKNANFFRLERRGSAEGGFADAA